MEYRNVSKRYEWSAWTLSEAWADWLEEWKTTTEPPSYTSTPVNRDENASNVIRSDTDENDFDWIWIILVALAAFLGCLLLISCIWSKVKYSKSMKNEGYFKYYFNLKWMKISKEPQGQSSYPPKAHLALQRPRNGRSFLPPIEQVER